ncbi:hypothetical protein QUF80_01400 [Desulfococcaceae bacterium HSG8]|nr:hypothetical protein [Desulfococcaceae bacterium HSG8]
MIVKFKKNSEDYPDMTSGQHYAVIGIEADNLRVLNDQGRPYLYPPRLFEVTDYRQPSDWITETGEDGEKYAYPLQLNRSGFFEDFFDGEAEAVAAFWRTVNWQLSAAEAV